MGDQLQSIFLLFVIFQVKHLIGDYFLQLHYMRKKANPGWDFLVPLLTHCLIHSGLTLAIVLWWNPRLWWLSAIDFGVHFVMDRVKAGPKYLGRFDNPRQYSYWYCFGLDQMVHHLTHIYLVWLLITC